MEKLFNRNFILMATASFMFFLGFYLVVPIVAMYVIDEFHASPSVAGMVVASYIITSLLVRPFSGYFVDRFDRRRFYLLVVTIFASLFIGYILSRSIGQLVLTRIMLGASFAMVTTASSTLAIDIMPASRRAEGIGYYGAFNVLSMAIGPMLGLYLLEIASYKLIFYCAFSAAAVSVLLSLFVRTKPRVQREPAPLSLDRFFLKSGLSLAIIMALLYFYYGSLMAYVSLYVREAGLSLNAGNFFMLFALGVVISRLLSGRIMKRGLYNELLQLSLAILVAASVLFIFYLTEFTLLVASVALGLGFGFAAPVIQTMIVELVGHNRRGTANSTFLIALDFGSGIGMLLGGVIAAAYGYRMIYIISLGLVLLALLVYNLYSRRDYLKQRARVMIEEV
ncbi:MAG: MFS transporter [Rikenellaceae bacterium]